MQKLFDNLFGRKPRSASIAADRLRFVLVTDRSELSPEQLRMMQEEIIDVIKKYCRIVESDVDIKLEQRARENFLVADIPLSNQKGEQDGKIAFAMQTTKGDD
jgi:cell division topological specificity factor